MKTTPWWMEIDPQTEFENVPAVRETKEKIKELDQFEMKMDDQFFENLHNKIMAQVENTKVSKKPRWTKLRKLTKTTSISLSILALVVVATSHTQSNSGLSVSDPVSNQAIQNMDDLTNSLLIAQTSSDFFVDVAQENMNHLDIQQLEKLMGKEAQAN
jgi:hypothetical protein